MDFRKSERGKIKREWGMGILNRPHGIAFDPNKQVVYVSDTYNDRIMVYSPTGQFLASFRDIQRFQRPRFMVLKGSKLYVTSVHPRPTGTVGVFEFNIRSSILDFYSFNIDDISRAMAKG